ncbi:hypothetical protein HDU76_000192 [Blyttiomyces sp. JEL0837]|nr:hypothetical protein HDU76_000192 [Blyttiomyces sp. JEL0837]
MTVITADLASTLRPTDHVHQNADASDTASNVYEASHRGLEIISALIYDSDFLEYLQVRDLCRLMSSCQHFHISRNTIRQLWFKRNVMQHSKLKGTYPIFAGKSPLTSFLTSILDKAVEHDRGAIWPFQVAVFNINLINLLTDYVKFQIGPWIKNVTYSFMKPTSPNHLEIVRILLDMNAKWIEPLGNQNPVSTYELKLYCNVALTKDHLKLCKLVWPFAYPDYDFNHGIISREVFQIITEAKWHSLRIDFFIEQMGVIGVEYDNGTSVNFLNLALGNFTWSISGNVKVMERLISLGANVDQSMFTFNQNTSTFTFNLYVNTAESRKMVDTLVKAGFYVSNESTTFTRSLIFQCQTNKTDWADYLIGLGALKPLTLVQTDLEAYLPADTTLWNMRILIETIAPDNCILLAPTSQMVNWFLDNGILPKSEDEVVQLATKAINSCFDPSVTRLIELGLITASQILDLIIHDFLSTSDLNRLESNCIVLQSLSRMGTFESVLNEGNKDFGVAMLLKCVDMGEQKLESKPYQCLERCLSAGVGKHQIQPFGNCESDSALFNQLETAVCQCARYYFPLSTMWFLNTPGYHPSVLTVQLLLEQSLRLNQFMLDVFDHAVKLIMESHKSHEYMVYEHVCNMFYDESQSRMEDSHHVNVLEVLARRSFKRLAPKPLVEVVSDVPFLSHIVEKSTSAALVFFWMFDVQLISGISEVNMNILLTRLLEKKLFDVIFNGFVARNISTFAAFTNILRDWFRANAGVADKDETSAGVEAVKWMVQDGLLVDEAKSGKVLAACIEGGNVFTVRMLFAMGHGNEKELMVVWKIIRVQGLFTKREAMKELLDQLLPGVHADYVMNLDVLK